MRQKILAAFTKGIVALWLIASGIQFLRCLIFPAGGAYGAGAITGSIIMLMMSIIVASKVFKIRINSATGEIVR